MDNMSFSIYIKDKLLGFIRRKKREIKKVLLGDDKWEDCERCFPRPNLIENKIYLVAGSDGNIMHAKFCFGEGEFWWVSPVTNKEVRVLKFLRE